MRRKHRTGGAVLSLALGAAVCPVVGAGVVGGPPAGVRWAALIVVVAVAWGTGRFFRSGAASGRDSPAHDEVCEEIVWECDAAGRFTHASPQCLELLGYAPEEARSLTLFDITHHDEHPVVTHLLEAGRGWRRRPFRCVTKDGAPVWLRSTAVARTDGQGRFTGLLGASHRAPEVPPGEVAGTSAAIVRVLADDAVRTAFQPIVSLADGRVLGVEALSRFPVVDGERSPDDWFTDAARVGLGRRRPPCKARGPPGSWPVSDGVHRGIRCPAGRPGRRTVPGRPLCAGRPPAPVSACLPIPRPTSRRVQSGPRPESGAVGHPTMEAA